MITIKKASKYFVICQSCGREEKGIWRVEFTTKLEQASHSLVVTLCLQCLGVLGACSEEVATKEHRRKNA